MRRGAAFLALGAAALLLSGCMSPGLRRYNRWAALQANGPFADWAWCIDQRSRGWLSQENPDAPPAWAKNPGRAEPREMFTWVLAACAEHMRGSHWQLLKDAQYRRLIDDAYEHFISIHYEILGAIEASIV